jgi:peptidoglycan/LPS O-acetylase OafA/YrhL
LSVLGLLLLLLSVIFIDQDQPYPGSWALLPVVGTLLIIAAGNQSWFNQSVLSNRVLVGIGLISYPLYLWHWPLLSLARILEQSQPDLHIRLLCIGIALGLSLLTYYFVERPIRFGLHLKAKTYILIALMSITASLGFVTYISDGFKSRFTNQLIDLQILDNLCLFVQTQLDLIFLHQSHRLSIE